MTKIKIGLVEDELIIAQNIKAELDSLGYDFTDAAINFEEAIEMIQNEKPDLLLLDINLEGNRDGIELAAEINKVFGLPFIFLTAFGDTNTILRAKEVNPHAYLIKPFQRDELFAAIEIALANFGKKNKPLAQNSTTTALANAMVIRDAGVFHKILYSDILYIESQDNYVVMRLLNNKKYITRASMNELNEQLPNDSFFRIHRQYIVSLSHIESITISDVIVAGVKIPVSKSNRVELLKIWNLG
jgi:DNA-binding LytR/AlgR family response regulator